MNSERIEEITVLSGKNRAGGEPENFDEIIIVPVTHYPSSARPVRARVRS